MAFNPTPGDDIAYLKGPGKATVDFGAGIDTLHMGTEPRWEYTIVKAADGSVRVDSISSASGGGLTLVLKNLEFISFDDGKGGRDIIDLRTFFILASPVTAATLLTGTMGSDVLKPASGQVNIDGLAGLDTVVLSQARSGYTVQASASGYVVAGKDGSATYTLSQVERLQFTDTRLALDLTGNAGITAKVLGAVFGAASVTTRPDYVGIGLKLLDSGTSYLSLMQMALDASLGASATPAQVVSLLYTNVVGSAPSASELNYYTGLLANKTYTPASLGVLAAETDLNQQQVNLVGLAQSGLDYIFSA